MLILTTDKWQSVFAEIKNNPLFTTSDRDTDQPLGSLIEDAVTSIYQAICDGWTLNIGVSFGKDSSAVLHLFLIALMRAVRDGRNISPHHWIGYTDTGIENPEVHWLAMQKIEQLRSFIEAHNLPLTIVIAKPNFTSSWVGRILTGRGLPTVVSSSSRQCSIDLKVTPAQRARAAYIKQLPREFSSKICLLLGSRDDEGSRRAASISGRHGSASRVVVTPSGGELYPVKEWSATNVWDLLTNSGIDSRYPLPSPFTSNLDTAELYADAQGECIWTPTNTKAPSKACGSRFGCSLCAVSGDSDKSMENLLADTDRYGYLENLNRLRNYLVATFYDWGLRNNVGRTIYDRFIKIQPDTYSAAMTEKLLTVAVSIDYAEYQRAERVAAALAAGQLESTPFNLRMAQPQFRLVNAQQIIHIDFVWSLHHFSPYPYRALEIYRQVWDGELLDLLDAEKDMAPVPRTPQPKELWLDLKKTSWSLGGLHDGLSDPLSEMNAFDDEEGVLSAVKTKDGLRKLVAFTVDSEITVNAETASFIVWEEYDRLIDSARKGHCTPAAAAIYYLRIGVISIAKGKQALYHEMSQRGQTYRKLGLSGNVSISEIAQRYPLLTTAQCHQFAGARLKSRVKKFNWLCFLHEYFDFNLRHSTVAGQAIKRQLLEERQLDVDMALQQQKNELWTTLLAYSNARFMVISCGYTRASEQYKFMKRMQRRCAVQLKELETMAYNDRSLIAKQIAQYVAGLELVINQGKNASSYGEWIAKASLVRNGKLYLLIGAVKRALKAAAYGKPPQQSLFATVVA